MTKPKSRSHRSTISNNKDMKFTQVSPRQLICEYDHYWYHMMQYSQLTVIGVIFLLTIFSDSMFGDVFGRTFGPLLTLIGIGLNFYHSRLRTIIDLNAQIFRLTEYWPLFRKSRIYEWSIAAVQTIEVKPVGSKKRQYEVLCRKIDGTTQQIDFTPDRLEAERSAERVRSFLGQR
jgi:hypothetical protein